MALSDAIREARKGLPATEAGRAAVYAAWEAEARNLEATVEGERLKRKETFRHGRQPTRAPVFGQRGRR